MIKIIPSGPWANPKIEDGLYEAVVEQVVEQTYGENEPMLKIILFLPQEELNLTTCIYFPGGTSIRSQQRLWHFCSAIGIEQHELVSDMNLANGKKLQIQVHRVQPTNANQGQPYSDVQYFFPTEKESAVKEFDEDEQQDQDSEMIVV